MLRELDSIKYRVLVDESEIQNYVVTVCEEEWSLEDFDDYGTDLYDQTWRLAEVSVSDILPQAELLKSVKFVADVTPRIAKQKSLYEEGTPIPPLILRGRDLFLFDGYARWHMFKEFGITRCFAYTSVP